MQAIGRWGNFFNQELYGPPTDLPWGITIDCAHRVAQYPCTMYPPATTGFHPLFLYESVSGILGAITLLWIARRWGPRMRPGDLFLIWLIWYATVRFALETLRTGNWTVLGVPTATIISALVIVGALVVLAVRHRPGAADGDRWGDPPEPAADADVAAGLEVPADAPVADVDDGGGRRRSRRWRSRCPGGRDRRRQPAARAMRPDDLAPDGARGGRARDPRAEAAPRAVVGRPPA